MSLTREVIISSIIGHLEDQERIIRCWEGGSAAFGRVDERSDIDLFLLVEDGGGREVLDALLSEIEDRWEVEETYSLPSLPWPHVFQVFVKLADTTPFLLLDIAVMEERAPEHFLDPRIHGDVVLLHDRFPEIDRQVDIGCKDLRKRVEELRSRVRLFSPMVRKEMMRGNPLKALHNYQRVMIDSIVEMLRIRHGPFHHDFGFRYLYRELPDDVVARLEVLAFVRDIDDLEGKLPLAIRFFDEAVIEAEQSL